MIVIDASAVLELLFGTDKGRAVHVHVARAASLHAPHLIDLEVAQVLRKSVLVGDMSDHRATLAWNAVADLGIEGYAHRSLLTRIWALRDVCTAYDASYVALAEVLDAPLVTCDARLFKARTPGAQKILVS